MHCWCLKAGGGGHDIVAILADEEPASLKHQLCDQCRFFCGWAKRDYIPHVKTLRSKGGYDRGG